MNKAVFEIKIIERKEVVCKKRYYVKSDALAKWEKLPKKKRTKSYPEIILAQCNYDSEGNMLSTVSLKKNRLNLEKISIENAKILLNG